MKYPTHAVCLVHSDPAKDLKYVEDILKKQMGEDYYKCYMVIHPTPLSEYSKSKYVIIAVTKDLNEAKRISDKLMAAFTDAYMDQIKTYTFNLTLSDPVLYENYYLLWDDDKVYIPLD